MKDLIYFWYFHYNIYTKQWNAFRRDRAVYYLNNSEDPDVLKAEDINTIIKWICSGKEKNNS